MVLKADQERVKALLSETILLLCKNGLEYKSDFTIEALIGITVDTEDVFLVSIKEKIENATKELLNDIAESNTKDQNCDKLENTQRKSPKKRRRSGSYGARSPKITRNNDNENYGDSEQFYDNSDSVDNNSTHDSGGGRLARPPSSERLPVVKNEPIDADDDDDIVIVKEENSKHRDFPPSSAPHSFNPAFSYSGDSSNQSMSSFPKWGSAPHGFPDPGGSPLPGGHNDSQPSMKPFSCHICGAGFTQSGVLNRHIRSMHVPQWMKKSYKCDLCNKGFSRKDVRDNHMKRSCVRPKLDTSGAKGYRYIETMKTDWDDSQSSVISNSETLSSQTEMESRDYSQNVMHSNSETSSSQAFGITDYNNIHGAS